MLLVGSVKSLSVSEKQDRLWFRDEYNLTKNDKRVVEGAKGGDELKSIKQKSADRETGIRQIKKMYFNLV